MFLLRAPSAAHAKVEKFVSILNMKGYFPLFSHLRLEYIFFIKKCIFNWIWQHNNWLFFCLLCNLQGVIKCTFSTFDIIAWCRVECVFSWDNILQYWFINWNCPIYNLVKVENIFTDQLCTIIEFLMVFQLEMKSSRFIWWPLKVHNGKRIVILFMITSGHRERRKLATIIATVGVLPD